ncbi:MULTISPECIES: arginase family protein [unclassified Sinorhizobium]|uniref:arginase family protein n=1 Tax=unclassified Sinorhizobium TaxID=2613772 RepID=UPI003525AD00
MSSSTTLRLHMPQWQGGNLAEYHLSSQLLSWLLPRSDGPEETIPVPPPGDGTLSTEDGIIAKSALLEQARAARSAIERHQPDRVLTIGGDCLVDLAPVAYLNKRYGGSLGVLWIDAHPDIQTLKDTRHAHAQVLGMLLGEGDRDFVREVDVHVQPSKVMYAGLDEWSANEDEVIDRLNLQHTASRDLSEGSASLLNWIAQEGIKHLAVHLDVDAMSPNRFRPILFNKPDAAEGFLSGVPRGRLDPDHVVRLLRDVSNACEIVGLAITEYISWDAIQTRKLLGQLPLV